ncbi:thioredoxin, mitochondrial [Vespula pensylvanica]|uniref:thioredoxin, mitochondrial n=1 Tax=Vespula pensylvanica TaxID=30213 RepID=UPI001CB9FA32|nr:thioredoxin, mitochondrial [Vespula pensylvanica]XP_043672638.1 thioredoxin, mitochondrial [Vespula pensylvanica]XP_043672639.1 thioredoxin, mitochondrial [Vespula pensylvanica]XP_043672640.1 thioredoxin, mitochondrial [Vespula pensylvanica]
MIRSINKSFPMWIRRISLSHQKKKVYEINSNIEFNNKVMNGKRTVVVNFHADWCDPCTVLTPKLIELIEPIETLDLAIINLESNPDLADVFSVKAVPAVFAMSNGLVLEKFIGLQDVGMIEKFVEKLTAQDATNSNIESNSVNLKMDNSVNPKGSDVKS